MVERKQVPVREGRYVDIQVDLTSLVFDRLFPTIVSGTVGLILNTALLAWYYKDPVLWAILWGQVVACGFRIAVVIGFKKRGSKDLTIPGARRWELVYGLSSICYGCFMAIPTARVFWRHDLAGELLCMVGSLTICSGLASRLGLRAWIIQLNGMVILATISIASLLSGQLLIQVAGLMTLVYSITFLESVQRNFNVVVEQLRGKRALAQLAQRDSLTNLANRRLFLSRLKEVYATTATFAVLFLDLDGFKAVNDTLGHEAGDSLLRLVAARLLGAVRQTDLVARLGGDEFAILQFPISGGEDATALAQRINQTIALPYDVAGHPAQVGVSIGVRLATGPGTEPELLLGNADAALYRAKAQGKGGFQVAAD